MKNYKYTGKITEEIERGLKKLEGLFKKVEKDKSSEGIEYIYYHDVFCDCKVLHVLQVSNNEILVGQAIVENREDIDKIPKRGKGCRQQFLDKINEIEELRGKIKQEK